MLIEKVSAQRVGFESIGINRVGAANWINWTSHLNGVNSYGEFDIWQPQGPFDIEFDYYLPEIKANMYFLEGRLYGGSGRGFLYILDDGQIRSAYSGGIFIDGIATNHIETGYHNLKITGASSGDVRLIGARWSGGNFKGQITNLKLTDHLDSKKSRVYENIIASSEMPNQVRLKDNLGDGSTDGVLYNLGTTDSYVPLLQDRQAYAGNQNGQLFIGGIWVENDISVDVSKIGTPSASCLFEIGDKLIAGNGAQLYIRSTGSTVAKCNRIYGSEDQIINGFKYPNVFTLVKPSDPDYGDFG